MTKTKTDETAQSTKVKQKTVTLSEPIELSEGADKITSLTLRRPGPGDLRGLSVAQLLLADADTYYEFLPRVVTPVLTSEQIVEKLDVADLISVMDKCGEFFAGK